MSVVTSLVAEIHLGGGTLVDAYRAMVRSRRFDEIAVALQRQGGISGYAQSRGQEASQIGVIASVGPEDMVFPSYRQPGAALAMGVSVAEMLKFHARYSYAPWDWRGRRFAPYTIPVGSQLAHATGWAMAEKRRGSGRVTFVFFGDGSSSQGEVHEAMNIAGVFDAPVVFICENNGWAISKPFQTQTRAATLHTRAQSYGFQGERVDGNDVRQVIATVTRAADRARAGGGPSLVETVTYRLAGHTTSDDPNLYRSRADVARWEALDPIPRLRSELITEGISAEDALSEVEAEVKADMDGDVDAYLAWREEGK